MATKITAMELVRALFAVSVLRRSFRAKKDTGRGKRKCSIFLFSERDDRLSVDWTRRSGLLQGTYLSSFYEKMNELSFFVKTSIELEQCRG